MQDIEKDSTYWAGWALAHYQWFSGPRFADLVRGGLTISKVKSLYILHEADICRFIEAADGIIAAVTKEQPTRLKTIRKARGFTQQEISEASGVTLRMIQLYEQHRNKINEASVAYVIRLSNALGCQPIDLM
ncbi:MAG: helix-turn-helix transcriptional regulator [Lachnospiraceae bacterium]|nr:helix-turn-helix transcriptional regulator [Lachnospiraceae bacterium]